jgi:hypothetical protein
MLPLEIGTGYSTAFIVDAAAVVLCIPSAIVRDTAASVSIVERRRRNAVTSFAYEFAEWMNRPVSRLPERLTSIIP